MEIVDTLVYVVIFSSLIGTIAVSLTNAAGNTSGAAATLLGLGTLFIVIGFIRYTLKKSGAKR